VGESIACANQKGGVGKTTTVVNLATYLALAGRRVLVVDLDPQGNATSGLGVDKQSVQTSIYDALIGDASGQDIARATAVEGVSLIPSAPALAGLEVELAGKERRERRLAEALRGADHDIVLLDCPPSLGLLTVNALTAASSVLVPVQCEYYALEGLSDLIATIHLVRDHLNPTLQIKGAVLTMFDPRTRLAADVTAEVRRYLGDLVYETVIPRSVRLSEAPSYGLPIALYDSGSRGAEAYRAFAEEFLDRPAGRQPATNPLEAVPA
jgi:chromosome partitioning protein